MTMERIIIEKHQYGFNVIQGDRYSDSTSFEETLGLVAHLLTKDNPHLLTRLDAWMRTREEWDKWRKDTYGGASATGEGEQ